jgi:hypothetical protein
MTAVGFGIALLGAGLAVGTKTMPLPLADSYAGRTPHAAVLTVTPSVIQPGGAAFGYTVVPVPAGGPAALTTAPATQLPAPSGNRTPPGGARRVPE